MTQPTSPNFEGMKRWAKQRKQKEKSVTMVLVVVAENAKRFDI
jgi:hypothetical protein